MGAAFLPGPLSVFVERLLPSYSGPALWMGLVVDGPYPEAIVITDDGRVSTAQLHELTVDVRYDWNQNVWVDVNGVVDGDEEEYIAPDGGSEVSGGIPELDGIGESHPLNEEGRTAASGAGRLDSGEEV